MQWAEKILSDHDCHDDNRDSREDVQSEGEAVASLNCRSHVLTV
jgi:hypothetical protein